MSVSNKKRQCCKNQYHALFVSGMMKYFTHLSVSDSLSLISSVRACILEEYPATSKCGISDPFGNLRPLSSNPERPALPTDSQHGHFGIDEDGDIDGSSVS